jgi:hypothetical protein
LSVRFYSENSGEPIIVLIFFTRAWLFYYYLESLSTAETIVFTRGKATHKTEQLKSATRFLYATNFVAVFLFRYGVFPAFRSYATRTRQERDENATKQDNKNPNATFGCVMCRVWKRHVSRLMRHVSRLDAS